MSLADVLRNPIRVAGPRALRELLLRIRHAEGHYDQAHLLYHRICSRRDPSGKGRIDLYETLSFDLRYAVLAVSMYGEVGAQDALLPPGFKLGAAWNIGELNGTVGSAFPANLVRGEPKFGDPDLGRSQTFLERTPSPQILTAILAGRAANGVLIRV